MRMIEVLVLVLTALAVGCTTVAHQPPPSTKATVQVPSSQMELSFVMNHCINAPYFGGIYQMPTGDGGTKPVLGIACLSIKNESLVHIFCDPNGMLCQLAVHMMQRDDRTVRVENELRALAERYRRR